MLRKTLLLLAVVAGFGAVGMIPVASAQTTAGTLAASTNAQCPSGNAAVGNYCEPHCIVPRLYGRSLLFAVIDVRIADCTVGKITIIFASGATADGSSIKSSAFGLYTVVRQSPLPGVIRPAGARVSIWVRFR